MHSEHKSVSSPNMFSVPDDALPMCVKISSANAACAELNRNSCMISSHVFGEVGGNGICMRDRGIGLFSARALEVEKALNGLAPQGQQA